MKQVDLLIAGAGVAGMSAWIYASRYDISNVIVGEIVGGAITYSHVIENYPGFTQITTAELVGQIQEQAKFFGSEFMLDKIEKIEKTAFGFRALLSGGEMIEGKRLLFALGSSHKHLGAKGEKEFIGKGVSYCATCDGMFYRNREVAVVGWGNAALTEALYLASICKKVYLIHRRDEFRADAILVKRAKNHENIELVLCEEVAEVFWENMVDGIRLVSGREIALKGVFVAIGHTPNVQLAQELGVAINERGYIVVDAKQKTSIGGIYAAGDISSASDEFKQVIVGAAEGALAAKGIHEELLREK